MEGGQSSGMNVQVRQTTELPLVAEGGNYDLTGFNQQVAERTPPIRCMQTAIFFDPGSNSHRGATPRPRFDVTPQEDESSELMGPNQVHPRPDRRDVVRCAAGWRRNRRRCITRRYKQLSGNKQIQRSSTALAARWRENPLVVIVIKQPLPSPAAGIPTPPPNLPTQAALSNWTTEPQQNGGQQAMVRATDFESLAEMFKQCCTKIDLLVELSKQSSARVDCASANFENAAASMRELARAMQEREASTLARTVQVHKDITDLRLGRTFIHPPRQAEEPPKSEIDHTAVKQTVRKYAMMIVQRATDDMLRGAWIEFEDTPRVGVDGFYLRDWITNEQDMSDEMSTGCVRWLKIQEGKKSTESGWRTHYVSKDWADLAMAGECTPDECSPLFDHPKGRYKLTECRRIVPFIKRDRVWFSLSIDLLKRETLLIHPAASNIPYPKALDYYDGLMRHLTYIALSNMNLLTTLFLTIEDWKFDLALKKPHPVGRHNLGAATLFYSIPKENQFMIVSEATIENAKHTFIHCLVKCCSRVTGRKVGKDNIPKPGKPPGQTSKRKKRANKEQKDPSTKPRDAHGKWTKEDIVKGKSINFDDDGTNKIIHDIAGDSSDNSDDSDSADDSYAPAVSVA